MNGLSWLIYAIHVVEMLKGVIMGLLGVGLAGLAFMAIAFCVSEGEIYTDDRTGPWSKRWTRRAQIAIIVAVPLLIIVPSRQTLLLVAGSEIGQRVVASEQVQSVVEPGAELLREWIRSETKRLRGKSE